MFIRMLQFFGWQNKIDLSPAGIDDLKIVLKLLFGVVIIIAGGVVPWMYGLMKIGILIFKG